MDDLQGPHQTDDGIPPVPARSAFVVGRPAGRSTSPYAIGPDDAGRAASRRLTWFLTAVTTLLLLRFVVPYFAEQIQYAITRGKQRAEYETAGNALKAVPLEGISQAYQLVSQRVAPSVVNINVVSVVEIQRSDDLSLLFGPRLREARGQGSGVIVDSAGYILTNNHVVADATEIRVGFSDGRIVPAQVVGLDPLTDLALLHAEADKLTAAEWGNSDKLEVGALVWAVGSPYGLQHSITAGILSGKNRQGITGSIFDDFLQTDAAVNPGNSGGPLVDVRGHVIGINTAIYGDAYQGISFAIPAKEARDVYDRLRTQGIIERGWLGVGLAKLGDDEARRFQVETDKGALVTHVAPDSPAERAGLLPGDVVQRWDGHVVDSDTALSRLVARTAIGKTVEMAVERRGQQLKLAVTVEKRPVLPIK